MGQEVKNLLRAQSKYGLMGYSAKTGKIFIRGSQEHFLHKSAIWDRTPPLHIKCSLYVCRRVHGSQIFKQISIISIHSKVITFFVISLSPCGPCGPHIVPVIPTLSPSSPEGPYVVLTPPMAVVSIVSTPHGPHTSVVPMLSLLCPCHPCHSHIISVIPTSSAQCLKGAYIIPNTPDGH